MSAAQDHQQEKSSRRNFLTAVSAGVPVLAVTGAATAAPASDARRRATPGPPDAPYSRAVSFGSIVFVAGVLGVDPQTRALAAADFEGQCRQALENLKASVEAAGSTLDRVLKCNCFLTEAGDFATMNRIYRGYFPSAPPARSTVVVKELVLAGSKIEIDCVTTLP